jgi:von Willebrand factor type A domain
MIETFSPILMATAQTAQTVTRTVFSWGRIQTNSDWIVPIGLFLLALIAVRIFYRSSSYSTSARLGLVLTILRWTVCLGLLLYYLQPQWCQEVELQVNSRVAIMVDTSLSMDLIDDLKGENRPRTAKVTDLLTKTKMIARLSKNHDLELFGFDNRPHSIELLPKTTSSDQGKTTTDRLKPVIDKLAPSGSETNLTGSLAELIDDSQELPFSGIILLSDGCQNGPAPTELAISAAREAKIPIFTFGVGSTKKRPGVRIVNLIAPSRAYPGDRYKVTGLIQADSLEGKTLKIKLFRNTETEPSKPKEELLETRQLTLGADGETNTVRFEIDPKKPGKETLRLAVDRLPEDQSLLPHHAETTVEIVDRKNKILLFAGGPMREYRFLRNLLFRDPTTEVDVVLQTGNSQISQEANRVLDSFPDSQQKLFGYDCIVAFDPDWNQLSENKIELIEKWVARSAGGLILIASPVHMGDPINGWLRQERFNQLKALFPVHLPRQFVATYRSAQSNAERWPLKFSREGREADFLQLDDDPARNRQIWDQFPGVYECFPVNQAKPSAIVYARFTDPAATEANPNSKEPTRPIYMAGHFYGSGRVLYIGSAEMWRLRREDPSYFSRFYIQAIRHTSAGRLLQGNNRGSFLLDRNRYFPNETVSVKLRLTDQEFEPYLTPKVEAKLIGPDQSTKTLPFKPDTTHPGHYLGHFQTDRVGTYKIELPLPDEPDKKISYSIEVRLPDIELRETRRNTKLLKQLANQTGGQYYPDIDQFLRSENQSKELEDFLEQLPDQSQTKIVSTGLDRRTDRLWLGCWISIVAGLLLLEWTIRRLNKLA